MSSTTENLGLTLPDVTDFYDVGVTNTNMSLIDSAVGQIADTGAKETSVQSIITKVGTTTDTGGTATTGTVMGKLNKLIDNMSSSTDNGYIYGSGSGSCTASVPTKTVYTLSGAGKIRAFTWQIKASYHSSYKQYTSDVIADNVVVGRCIVRSVNHSSGLASYLGYYIRIACYPQDNAENMFTMPFQYPTAYDQNAIVYDYSQTALVETTFEDMPTDGNTNKLNYTFLAKDIVFNTSLSVVVYPTNGSMGTDDSCECRFNMMYQLL